MMIQRRLARALCAVLVATTSMVGSVAAAPAGQSRAERQQTGYATYYSRAFEGEETASGETFDADALVAAHRTLPFDSVVQVTNLENGRRVQVRIVDRGPYGQNWREGTIIDLAPAAAKRLGMMKDGQVRVRVQVLKTGAVPRTAAR